ncbi:MAG: serine/threonine-protein phosphatase, partial [Candidatus Eremiobacteraeota bacterium]|nr:serine/threonine-protein phosphatase [Candidatus Eremiobacteraeota bacterium]
TPAPAASAPAAAPEATGSGQPVGTYQVAMVSNIGCVRSINQDACLELRFTSVEKSNNRDGHLVAVIDGMGGEAEGDKAASLALRAIAQEVVSLSLSLRNGRHTAPLMPDDAVEKNRFIIQRALEVANRTIHEYASLDRARQGMGCTITAALFDGQTAVFGHVGDTRAYLYRGGLDQITTDHSLVGRLVEMGQMTPEEARNSPQRSIIYRAMGTNPEVEVDVYERKLEAGDYVMMSSDGVWEYFEQGELRAVFERLSDPHEICEELVRICLERGADDNATVAIVHALGGA